MTISANIYVARQYGYRRGRYFVIWHTGYICNNITYGLNNKVDYVQNEHRLYIYTVILQWLF